MAQNPSANLTIDEEAGGFAGGTGYCVVIGCAEKNADVKPRVFTSHKALLTQHGYSQGARYVAMHIKKTRKPVIFVALATSVDGVIGRQDNSGVSGSAGISVAAGAAGILEEVRGRIEVVTGGTVGTPGIVFDVSMDGGRNKQRKRLGASTSYAVPYVGLTLNFGPGTLVAGDVFTFATTAPSFDPADIAAAKAALAAQQKLARSWVIVRDFATKSELDNVTAAANEYETENQRFTYARVQGFDGGTDLPTKSKLTKKMTGTGVKLTFAEVGATGDTITRDTGSWVDDGFDANDLIDVSGSTSNNFTNAKITAVTPTVLTLDTQGLVAEVDAVGVTVTASASITFAEVGTTGDTITRSSGSWLNDGFKVGDTVNVTGTASNNVSGATIGALTDTLLTLTTTDLAAEVVRSDKVTITKVETMSAWVSKFDTAFTGVDDERRIDIAGGRGRKLCPITKWAFRSPAAWGLSIREYEHDLHIPCWRKADGPLDGWDIADEDGTIVEYDETNVGGLLAARVSCFRSYGNGPIGTFGALSLTRASEASLLSRTHNMAVANHACTVTQAETENAIGQVLVLKANGRATEASLQKIEERVNTKLDRELLSDQLGEGQRASIARWTASRDNILNVPGAKLTGVLRLELNGTLEEIDTSVLVQTGG